MSWVVDSDGKIRGALKAKDGHAITKDIVGTMVWPGEVADEERDVALDENGNLVASGPPLQDDLTEIDYSLTVEGSPWTGTLHVPRGGTKAIDDDAKVAANLTVPQGKLGPNGGTIQYIGNTPVEMVADSTTHEMRLYVLDSNYNVVDPGERTFRVGYAANYSGMQVLVREPDANYYVWPLVRRLRPLPRDRGDDVRRRGPHHACIIGWSQGAPLAWGGLRPVPLGRRPGLGPLLRPRCRLRLGLGLGPWLGRARARHRSRRVASRRMARRARGSWLARRSPRLGPRPTAITAVTAIKRRWWPRRSRRSWQQPDRGGHGAPDHGGLSRCPRTTAEVKAPDHGGREPVSHNSPGRRRRAAVPSSPAT